MIRSIRGKLIEKNPTEIIVETGGIGYGLSISLATYDHLAVCGAMVDLFVYQHVREDQIALYGFSRREERKLFLVFLGISGVGPRLALTILSHIGISDFIRIVRAGQIAGLTAISGVGKKTAERLIFELKDKLSPDDMIPEFGQSSQERAYQCLQEDAVQALMTLGYKYPMAKSEVQKAAQSFDTTGDVGDLVRKILSNK